MTLGFRVFDKETNKYIDDSEVELLLRNDGVLLVGNFRDEIQILTTRYVVEHSTGLKDSTGKLIYEGDIVRCDRDFDPNGRVNLRKEVIFWLGSFKLANCNPSDRDAYYIDKFHHIEIIDNIHNYPEQKGVEIWD